MGRRRLEMKLIENQKALKRAFEKRRNNLLKKAEELSILCDVKILVIIYELGKQKPETWPDNADEAKQMVERFKQQRASKKACDSSASKKKRFGDKFAISDYRNKVNHFSGNQLQKLSYELDAKIAAVVNVIQSKQVLTGVPRSPMVLGYGQGVGFLNKGKGKEVVSYQEPVNTQQNQSFQMLSHSPMQNGISYPEFDGSSSGSNIPYIPSPIHYADQSWMQQPYMNASNSSIGCYDPTIYQIPPNIYYLMMPGFPTQMNASD